MTKELIVRDFLVILNQTDIAILMFRNGKNPKIKKFFYLHGHIFVEVKSTMTDILINMNSTDLSLYIFDIKTWMSK